MKTVIIRVSEEARKELNTMKYAEDFETVPELVDKLLEELRGRTALNPTSKVGDDNYEYDVLRAKLLDRVITGSDGIYEMTLAMEALDDAWGKQDEDWFKWLYAEDSE